MHPSLKQLITQYVAVIGAALFPVVVAAFLTTPYNLGGHPGEVSITTAQPTHFS